MREKMICVWRKMTTIKVLHPLIVFIRYFASTNFFNTVLDFMEVKVFHTSYKITEEYLHKNKKRIREITESLADEKSRIVYRNIWKYRATHNRKYLKGIVDREQYFDSEIIKLTEKEVFVDCGAYKGDTIREFYKHLPVQNKCSAIVAFEPDKYNFKMLKKYVEKLGKSEIECYPLGTWNEKAELRFRGNTEEGCMISDSGDTVIHTDTIDTIIGDRKVSYIKMDVEGAELKSLVGAKTVIEREHPRLAISIYHSDEDMTDIIEYLKENYPFYKLYVRHYTWFYADTVLYAVDDSKKFS